MYLTFQSRFSCNQYTNRKKNILSYYLYARKWCLQFSSMGCKLALVTF